MVFILALISYNKFLVFSGKGVFLKLLQSLPCFKPLIYNIIQIQMFFLISITQILQILQIIVFDTHFNCAIILYLFKNNSLQFYYIILFLKMKFQNYF